MKHLLAAAAFAATLLSVPAAAEKPEVRPYAAGSPSGGIPQWNPGDKFVAIAGGADFIKTSTGKVTPAATLPVTLCMLEVIRDVHDETGLVIGMKPAGGIRTAKQSVQYLCVLHETLGPDWMTPDLFRFGASSLLNDVLLQLRKQRTGIYRSPDEMTLD